MSVSDLWPLAIEAWEALGAGYGPVMARTAANEAGFPEGAYFGWILPALGLRADHAQHLDDGRAVLLLFDLLVDEPLE